MSVDIFGNELEGEVKRFSDSWFGTSGPVQHREDGLYTPVLTMRKNDRSIQLAGVVHVADSEYWARWERELLDLVKQGREVQMELVRSEKHPHGKDLPAPLKAMGKALRRWINANGLTLQTDIIKPNIDAFTVTDMSMETLMKRLDGDMLYLMAASTFAYPMIAALSMVKRELIPAILVKALRETEDVRLEAFKLVAENKRLPKRLERKYFRNRVIIEERNAIAIEAMDGAATGMLAMWGAAHLPGISEGLFDRGWTPTAIEWRRAIAS